MLSTRTVNQEERIFHFLSDILDKKLFDREHRNLGKIRDVIALTGEIYPKITSILVEPKKNPDGQRLVLWNYVQSIEKDFLKLNVTAEDLQKVEPKAEEIFLRAEIMDRQIVDTYGCKVVRVNDLHLVNTNNELRVVHVDIGFRGLMRRIGLQRICDLVTQWRFDRRLEDRFISWKYVQLLPSEHNSELKINLSQRKLSELHPADLAEILEDLNIYQQAAIFQALEVGVAAEMLGEFDSKTQTALIETLDPADAVDILEEMPPDEAADLLSDLDKEVSEELLEDMAEEKSEEMRELLSYEEDTAGGMMTTEYISIPLTFTVGQALKHLKDLASSVENIYYTYVVDEEEYLLGVLTMRSLITSSEETPISEIMQSHPLSVKVNFREEEVAELFAKYEFHMLPVVDGDEKIKGVITLSDSIKSVWPKFKKG